MSPSQSILNLEQLILDTATFRNAEAISEQTLADTGCLGLFVVICDLGQTRLFLTVGFVCGSRRRALGLLEASSACHLLGFWIGCKGYPTNWVQVISECMLQIL